MSSLRRNVIWMFAGRTVYAACQWGLLIVLAKLSRPEMLGQYVLALAITAPIIMLTNLQLRLVQATDAGDRFCFSDYLNLRLRTSMLALGVFVVVALAMNCGKWTQFAIVAMGFARVAESLSDVLYGFLQKHERMVWIARAFMVRGIAALAAFALTVFLTGNLVAAILALAASWILVLCFLDVPMTRRLWMEAHGDQPMWVRSSSWTTLGQLAWIALPLGVVTFLMSLEVNVPRYIVQYRFGNFELGIFGALIYVMVIGQTIVVAISQPAIPRLSKHYVAGRPAAFTYLLGKLVRLVAVMSCALLLAVFLFGQPLLDLTYGSKFSDHGTLFVWIAAASGIQFLNMVTATGLRAMRKFKSLMVLQLVSLGLISLCCGLLSRSGGTAGIAQGILLAGIVNFLMLTIVTYCWIQRPPVNAT
jgi:O-antigen/teichoic acid export membrane protein